ncbi:palmitoyltransferase ZDHHC5-like [Orbicella faveolata]|uniref:palmitoyltransferase ZDHHC5-like n=1 Tax=Orbicella faveolata TaxID=48498 RepID=UPI0009E55AA9|nr:palmitoyltransferase ZDHHC5-like [Orbicella faveolata]
MSRSRPCEKFSSQQVPIICAAVLLIGTTTLFFVFVCPHLTKEYSVAIPIYDGIVTLIVLASFANASVKDPGVIPREQSLTDQEDDFRVPLYKNVDINGITVRMKWCDTCKFYRPPRCSHCSICNNCIENFDHHCPWVDNCIGKRNYRYFFFFVFSLSIHIISVFIFSLMFVLEKMGELAEVAVPIAIMVVCGLTSIPVIGLTVFHIGLVAMGRTTNEQVTGKFRSGHNPFDQGCKKNCVGTLCSSQYAKYVGYMESLARQVTKQDTKKDKRKDKEKEAKNQTDGTELSEVKVEVASNHTNQHSQDGIKNSSGKNSQQTREQDGRSLRPDSFAAAVNTGPRVSATYVKSSRNGRTISGSREVTV